MTRTGWLLAAIVVLGTARFLPGCAGTEMVLDDTSVVEQHPAVRENAFGRSLTAPWWWTSGRPTAPNWRPLTLLSFTLQHALMGTPPPEPLSPAVWRGVNLCCYAGVIWLVWWLARMICGADSPALAATLLFAFHPAHVEAVVPVVGRADLLATAAVIGACGAWLRWRAGAGERWRVAAVAAFALGVAAKESAAPLAVLLPLLDQFVVPAAQRPAWRARLRSYVPIAVTAAVWLGLRWAVLGDATLHHAAGGTGFSATLLGASRNAGWSLLLFVWPWWTHHILTTLPGEAALHYPPMTWSAGGVALLVLAVAAATGWWGLRRRAPRIAFAWAAAVACWLPTSGLIPIGAGVALRFLFTPSVFACLALALALERWWPAEAGRARAVRTALGVGLAATGLIWGGRLATRWHDLLTFHEHVLAQVPTCYGSLITAGGQHHRRGDVETAVRYLEQARAQHPERPGAYRNLVIVYSFGRGVAQYGWTADLPRTEALLRGWIAAAPRSWEPWVELGRLQRFRREPAARRSFEEALTRQPPPEVRQYVEEQLRGG